MKKYYKYWDTFRAVLVVAVLLFHLNVLPGGFLAVCCFFVLSGYLTARSLMNKGFGDLKDYYSARLRKLYFPLITVVFITMVISYLLKDLVWVSLKPETTSVLLLYNNFWQISANLDYFARHTDSPFMHFWYISILLQFDLVFPVIFITLKKIFSKARIVLDILFHGLAIAATWLFFMYYFKTQPIMTTYYHTFSRLFSLLLGVACFLDHRWIEDKPVKFTVLIKVLFWALIGGFIYLFVTVDSASQYFGEYMVLASVMSCLLIALAGRLEGDRLNFLDKIFKFISSISYEVYLVQYPVIIFAQYLFFEHYELPVGRIAIALVSVITAIIINYSQSGKNLKLKWLLLTLLITVNCLGCARYVVAKDNTAEMKALEEQLAQNEKMLEEKQKEYEAQAQAQREQWEKMMAELQDGEEGLKDIVTNLPVTCIGDSVMLGAEAKLYETFKNGYVDAQVSRTGWVVEGIITPLKKKGILGKAVVIHLGTNGDVPERVKDKIMEICEGSEVFWVTVTNDRNVHVNDKLKAFVNKYDNAHLLDWETLSAGHTEYFYSDGIHLNPTGRRAYANEVYGAIYNLYLEQFNQKKQEVMDKIEQEKRERIGFYGNDLLVGVFDTLKDTYTKAGFNVAEEEYTFQQLLEDIKAAAADDSLSYRLVFAYDHKFQMSEQDCRALIEAAGEREICFVTMKQDLSALESYENVTVVDFRSQINQNGDYLLADKQHLSPQGNQKLAEMIRAVLDK